MDLELMNTSFNRLQGFHYPFIHNSLNISDMPNNRISHPPNSFLNEPQLEAVSLSLIHI